MGNINKHANLYDRNGKLIAKAPLKSIMKQQPPMSSKYPGGGSVSNFNV